MRKYAGWVAVVGLVVWCPTATAQGTREDAAAKERQLLLETVGLLTASQVYQGYLNIGLVADGKAAGTYDEKAARQLIESVLGLVDATDKKLELVGKMDIGKEDRIGLYKLRQLNQLLRRQTVVLKEFWSTGKQEYANSYERLRKEAWEGISKQLKLGS